MARKALSAQEVPVFEQIRRIDEHGNEYWSARDLSKVLEYSEYRHFLPVVERAKEACKNSGHHILDHFEDILEMVVRCRPHACAGSHGNQANFHNPVQVARSATRCGVWARSAATLHPRPSATPAGGGEPCGEQVGIKEMMVFRTKRNEQD